MRYKTLQLAIIFNLLCVNVLSSFSFLSSPLQLPSGETVLGLGYLEGIRISPDNRTLILYGKNGVFLIKNDRILIKRLVPEQFVIRCEFSPDNSKLLISKYNGAEYGGMVFDLIQEKPILSVYENRQDNVTIPSYPFSPDGKEFVYYQSPNVNVAQLDTGQQTILPNVSLTTDTFFSDNQQIINTQIRNASAYLVIWDARTGNEIRSVLLDSPYHPIIDNPYNLWSPRNGVSVLGWGIIPGSIIGYYRYQVPIPMTNGISEEIYIHVWDSLTGRIIKKWGIRNLRGISSANVILSPNRQWVVLYTKYFSAELIDLNNEPSENPKSDLGPFDHIYQATITPDSQSIFLLSRTNYSNFNYKFKISQLDLNNYTLCYEQFLYWYSFQGSAFSPDGFSLAFYDANDHIILRNWKQGKNTDSFYASDFGKSQLAYSPDGKLLLSGNSKYYDLWDMNTGKQIKTYLIGDQQTQCTVAFNRDSSKYLASGYIKANTPQPYIVKIWDIDSIAEIQTLKGHTNTILSAHFSPDGKQVITASEDQTAKVWDIATGQMISTYINHATSVNYAEFFPDGKRVITADIAHNVHIWDAETGAVQTTLQNVNTPVVLAPNGKWLFAGTQVWDTATWKIIKVLDGKEQDLNALTVSPDNLWLLTSESNGITLVRSIPEHIISQSKIKQFQEY